MNGDRLLVCAPLRVEALALRRGLPAGSVRHTGFGVRRSRQCLPLLAADPAAAVAVAGVCAATRDDLRPGDVVVATEVNGVGAGAVRCPSAPVLVHALRRRGCRVWTGPVRSIDHLVSGTASAGLGRDGVLAVDLEAATLAGAAHGRPLAVVRVVVDTPARPLARVDLPVRGGVALARLGVVGEALGEWAQAAGLLRLLLARPRWDRALHHLARQADVVLVLGVASSSNSQRLVEIARRHGTPAHLVDGVEQVDPRWLAGAGAVGISVSASAPGHLVDAVVDALRGLGAGAPEEVVSAEEAVSAAEPVPLRLPEEVDR